MGANTYIRIKTAESNVWDRLAHSYIPGKNEVCIITPHDNDSNSAIKIGDGETMFGNLGSIGYTAQADWKT